MSISKEAIRTESLDEKFQETFRKLGEMIKKTGEMNESQLPTSYNDTQKKRQETLEMLYDNKKHIDEVIQNVEKMKDKTLNEKKEQLINKWKEFMEVYIPLLQKVDARSLGAITKLPNCGGFVLMPLYLPYFYNGRILHLQLEIGFYKSPEELFEKLKTYLNEKKYEKEFGHREDIDKNVIATSIQTYLNELDKFIKEKEIESVSEHIAGKVKRIRKVK